MRCSAQPVFAARRITLPVFGGISGWTRTMLNMRCRAAVRRRRACARPPTPATDRRRPLSSVRAASASRRAGGHHVVDERHVAAPRCALAPARLTTNAPRTFMRAALGRQAHLARRCRAGAPARGRRREGPGARHAARQLPGLVVAALAQACRAERHRDDQRRRRASSASSAVSARRRASAGARSSASRNFSAADQAIPRKRVVDGRHGAIERRRVAHAVAAARRAMAVSAQRGQRTTAGAKRSKQAPQTRPRDHDRHTAHRLGKARAGTRPIYCPPHGRHLARCARGRAQLQRQAGQRAALAARRSGAPHGRAAAGDPLDACHGARLVGTSRRQRRRACRDLPQGPSRRRGAHACTGAAQRGRHGGLVVVASALGGPRDGRRGGGCRGGGVWAAAVGEHDAPRRQRSSGRDGRWQRALAIDGFLMFSCFGPDTLAELRALYHAAGWPPPAHRVHRHARHRRCARAGRFRRSRDGPGAPHAHLGERRAPCWTNCGCSAATRIRRALPPSARRAGERAWSMRSPSASRPRAADSRVTFEIVYGHAFNPAPRARVAERTEVSLDAMRAMVRHRKERLLMRCWQRAVRSRSFPLRSWACRALESANARHDRAGRAGALGMCPRQHSPHDEDDEDTLADAGSGGREGRTAPRCGTRHPRCAGGERPARRAGGQPDRPAPAGHADRRRADLAAQLHAGHLHGDLRRRVRRDVLFDVQAPQVARRQAGQLPRERRRSRSPGPSCRS